MKVHKNTTTLIAISSSILLLLVLQIFWLRMEFKDELSRFHRDSHMMFRNTILELNDSLVQKNILALSSGENIDSRQNDSVGNIGGKKIVKIWMDSLSSAHIYRPDKPQPAFRDSSGRRAMMFRFRVDSMDQGIIQKKYIEQLNNAGLSLPVDLVLLNDSGITTQGTLIKTEEIITTPSGTFKIEFSDLNWLILKNLIPQISFSLILTILVIGSFVLVYKNLLLQQRLVGIKDGLISNISHELKTPITTVSLALEGLRNFKGQNDPLVSGEYLTIAENELKRLSLLTDKVLKTSLEDQVSTSTHFQSFDFLELVYEVVKSFNLIAEKKGLVISIHAEDGNYLLEGDRDDLSTVLFNLLDNALKYSPRHGMIKISLKENQNNISILIQDNGVGIPKEYQDKIFDKFFRVPSGDLHVVKGYGLGLSYVKQVVKNHKGEIDVESEENSGSRFIITLPKVHAEK